jgi:DMSO reductase family type II enzyme molybdopterin subunit
MTKLYEQLPNLSRRGFLKTSGTGVGLSLLALNGCASETYLDAVASGDVEVEYENWEDVYRNEWQWDNITWGSHNNQCNPAGCSFRVYSKNGMVWREEQTANNRASNDNYPDFNPLGCQKGCGFHSLLYSEERLRYPMQRVGERGEGKWKRISWDDALEQIADSILDAHQDAGPNAFHLDAPHIHAGSAAWAGAARLTAMLGGIVPDTNVEIGDDLKGITQVFGKMRMGYSADNFMDAELIVSTNCNWAYTAPPMYHFLTEARYNGTELIQLSPDYSASCVHADIHIPLKTSSDAAFWLGVCHEIIVNNWQDEAFIREQTDLAMLVRRDTQTFLNAQDVEGGRPDQFYFYDLKAGSLAKAPQSTLRFDGVQALEGSWQVTLSNGKTVTVEPTMVRLKDRLLNDYTPEKAAEICQIDASLIRMMANKVTSKRTHFNIGFTSAKHYHGDLMERALLLTMALSANWGKPGTGVNNFLAFTEHAEYLTIAKRPIAEGGLEDIHHLEQQIAQAVMSQDPNSTREQIGIEVMAQMAPRIGLVPPSLWMYKHAGYSQLWDKQEWQDPTDPKSFGEYFQEGLNKGYIQNEALLNTPPQVLMYMAHNPLRRQRSGRKMYTENLWPKAKMIFSLETRMSTSAAFADIVLPSAWYYEKEDIPMPFSYLPFISMQQKAVEPPGEARPEWEVFADLAKKIGERAQARGMSGYTDHFGASQPYAQLHNQFTMNRHLLNNRDVQAEFVRFNAATGIMPEGYTLEQFEKDGAVRIHSAGAGLQRETQASDVSPDAPLYPLGWNVDKKIPYATHTRRAQFYIDHEWFIDNGEALPVHKGLPPIGGMHPYQIISGHPRISVHTLHQMTPKLMKLHRGQPVAFINKDIAKQKGIEDGDMIKVWNDQDSAELMASIAAGVAKDQIAIYMWEPTQFKDWKSHDAMLVGMPKGSHLAMNYKQLRYGLFVGSPNPTGDRGLRVDFSKID